MKPNYRARRREFLLTTTAAGVVDLLGSACNQWNSPDLSTTDVGEDVPLAKVLPRLAAIAREHVCIPKEEGQLLHLLIKLTHARRVLELGTGYGYTSIWLALALAETGGKLTTVEIVPERVARAREYVAAVGLSHRVAFHEGDAHAIVPTLAGPFDIAYFDADKGGNLDYFSKLFPQKLPPGSLLIAHNAILLADKLRPYLETVQRHPDLETLIVRATADDGLALSYRRRRGWTAAADAIP